MSEPIAPHESAAPQHPAGQPGHYGRPVPGGPRPYGEPRPKVGPATALKNWAKGIFSVSGRASRSEYWWPVIILSVIPWLLTVLAYVLAMTFTEHERYPLAYNDDGSVLQYYEYDHPNDAWQNVALVFAGLAFLLALTLITVSVRRLHDANFSGWCWFLGLVPVGNLVLLVFCLLPGNPAGVRFDGAFARRLEGKTPPAKQ